MKKIYISGSTGFIGTHLSAYLKYYTYQVVPITRREFKLSDADFCAFLSPADIIINLAGAPIMKRWTPAYKIELQNSRILTARKLATAITQMDKKPSQFISVSAIGIYNDKGRKDEFSDIQTDNFLGQLGKAWEDEALQAAELTKTAICRMGIVLDKNGGALKTMLPIFKIGLGGRIGNGTQMMSWIHISDVVSAFHFIIKKKLQGTYNFTAPYPVSNAEFSKSLAAAVKRPAIFTVPTFALRLAYGEGAEVLTNGQEVYPFNLQRNCFAFKYGTISKALKAII